MKVTHVIRADEFISSTPKFLSLYEALGIEPPVFVTLPPILAEGGNKKLSKRDGAKDILQYGEEGYLPEAMMNFLALLGWNPGTEKEIFTQSELTEAFDISRIQISGAQVNLEKLDWMNKEHMKRLSAGVIKEKIFSYLSKEFQNEKLIPIIFDRISKWSDVKTMEEAGELGCFSVSKQPKYDKAKLVYKNSSPEKISSNLQLSIKALTDLNEENFTAENIKQALMLVADRLESRGELLHPVRYALSGKDKSPDPFIIASILGKNETLSRLQKAI
jgi:glutamyl/glutaminyl-tRNA synthetase